MADLYSEADLDALSLLHSGTGIFARIDLPSGESLLHTGMGRKVIGGETWEGVTNPFGGALVEIGEIEEPEFGQAPAINVMIAGNNRAFLKSMWDDRFSIEGATCDLYSYDQNAETGEVLIGLKRFFPGKLTALRFNIVGANVRTIHVRIVSVFEGLNFPSVDADWSPSGQRRRYAGDKGLDEMGQNIIAEFIP